MTSERLDGATAIVTGASSGIGEATAIALAGQGANVVLAARRENELEAVADEIESTRGTAVVVPTDVSNENDIDTLVEITREEFDSLDILINNAGAMLLEPVERADRANFRQMVEVNLLGMMNLCHAVLPVMQEQGTGHIVNVSSASGRRAGANASAYSATKFGVNGFTEALRQEVTTDGVRTTLIEPGRVGIEVLDQIPDEEVRAQIEAELAESIDPLESEDVARSIVYAVTQPQRVNVNEILLRPITQKQ